MARRSKASRRRAALKGWRKRRGKRRRRRVRRKSRWGRKAKARVKRLYRLRRAAGHGGKGSKYPRGSIGKMRRKWTKVQRRTADTMLARLRRYTVRGKVGARAKKRLKPRQRKLLREARKWLRASGARLSVAARRNRRR